MAKKVKILRNMQGTILVFGGVYSNFQALEAIFKKAMELNIPPSNIICTGDLVAYCAQPLECITFVQNWGIECIVGNVEINLYQGDDDCGCNFDEGSRCDTFSRQWYPFLKDQIGSEEISWMENLPHYLKFNYADRDFFVLHGSFFNTSEFIFKSTGWDVKSESFKATSSDVILAGHCGIPFSDEKNGRIWLNTGVIGMPANDGSTNVWYALLDDTNGSFSYQICALGYDFETAASLLESKPLPQSYKKTLISGLWDNCEILPAAEANAQGQPLSF